VHKEFEIEPFCPCSEEAVLRALSSLGREGLESLFLEGGEAELFCEFCRKRYAVGQTKILEMLNEEEENENDK
jgi:molecular chaperone Hsp33